jgi:hypothetical protein
LRQSLFVLASSLTKSEGYAWATGRRARRKRGRRGRKEEEAPRPAALVEAPGRCAI